jgi:hypothetical protein
MLHTVKPGGKKKVLIDAYHNCIFTRVRTLTLVKLLEDHGFSVHTLLSPIADKVEVWDGAVHGADLKDYDVLSIPGLIQAGIEPTEAELARIKQFAADGGGLFLAAQHYRGQHGHFRTRRASRIAELFGVRIGDNAVLDPQHCVFDEPRFLTCDRLSEHPITRGCRLFQSGGSASLFTDKAPGAITLISSHDSATTTSKQDGPFALAVALQHERGRVVIMGDSDWLEPLTLAEADNRKIALGIYEWLAKLR